MRWIAGPGYALLLDRFGVAIAGVYEAGRWCTVSCIALPKTVNVSGVEAGIELVNEALCTKI